MAKDGTQRGGMRAGAGKKRKSGNLETVLTPVKLSGTVQPDVKEFLKALQTDGSVLQAEEIFWETYEWLKERECENFVSRQFIEQYAMTAARWIHCEQMVSEYGYISQHPTTGNAIQSPYVSMSKDYLKEANYLWQQIFQVCKEKGAKSSSGSEDEMEILLRRKQK